jgi:hypothetical protein
LALCHSFHLSFSLKDASRHFSLPATAGSRFARNFSRHDEPFLVVLLSLLLAGREKLRVNFGGPGFSTRVVVDVVAMLILLM